ncbi:hypothetical protein Leryth_019284 [Lithospermum erythrorhizon]|nr:hypothetical protein Leryth_019284 [Lithospermum erythrorhizon]
MALRTIPVIKGTPTEIKILDIIRSNTTFGILSSSSLLKIVVVVEEQIEFSWLVEIISDYPQLLLYWSDWKIIAYPHISFGDY